MTVQVGAKPPTRTTASTVIAHDSNVLPKASVVRTLPRCRQSEFGGKHDAHQAATITAEDRPSMA
ncbi:MAG TPA: hypothetical protein VI029_00875, partial [Mycobacterium sp.]